MQQAVDKNGRFRPVLHKKLQLNDIVLLKEDNIKRANFPLRIVQSLNTNELGEDNTVTIKKVRSGVIVKRHVSSLIPVLTSVPRYDNSGRTTED